VAKQADENRFRPRENGCEIRDPQRQAEAEHDDAESHRKADVQGQTRLHASTLRASFGELYANQVKPA
jgi:hypothetical protein